MEHWFKDKSKALLASGIDHVKVMGVWDEEYDLYILSFKDFVDESNNTTIMFHEPSNRWVTEAQFEYTPAEGYNQILELTYSVVRGFENGIGYSFDEETRFATFNIGDGVGTSANIFILPDEAEVVVSVPAPTITISCPVTPTVNEVVVTVPDPTIFISYISVDDVDHTWASDETGTAYRKTSTVTQTGNTTFTVTSFPSWLIVEVQNGAVWELASAGTEHATGSVLGFRIENENTGTIKSSAVVLTDQDGNTKTITVTQSAPTAVPYVYVAVDDDDTSGLVLYEASGVATEGDETVTITFTPDCPLYGYMVDMTFSYEAYADSVLDSSGTIILVRNKVENTKSIELSTAAGANTAIIILLSVPS
jgi:hypothetical protein